MHNRLSFWPFAVYDAQNVPSGMDATVGIKIKENGWRFKG